MHSLLAGRRSLCQKEHTRCARKARPHLQAQMKPPSDFSAAGQENGISQHESKTWQREATHIPMDTCMKLACCKKRNSQKAGLVLFKAFTLRHHVVNEAVLIPDAQLLELRLVLLQPRNVCSVPIV